MASCRTRDYDLILMDWQMPILDGFAAVSKRRAGTSTAA